MPGRTPADAEAAREIEDLRRSQAVMVVVGGDELFEMGQGDGQRMAEITVQDMAMIGMDAGQTQQAAGATAEEASLGGMGMHDIRTQSTQTLEDGFKRRPVLAPMQAAAKPGDDLDGDPMGLQPGGAIRLIGGAGAGEHGDALSMPLQLRQQGSQHTDRATIVQTRNDVDEMHAGRDQPRIP